MDIEKTCFFTGHRKLPHNKMDIICTNLQKEIVALIDKGVTNFISGGAYGFDSLCADTIIRLQETNFKYAKQIKLFLYLPCLDQSKNWSIADKFHFNMLLFKCTGYRYITKDTYTDTCMKKRNFAMVDDALFGISFCINSYSGTGQTVRYAEKKGRHIVNIADFIYE